MENTITILGCGWTLPQDVEVFGIKGDVMAVNHTIAFYPGEIRHACMIDYRTHFKSILGLRKGCARNIDFVLHSEKPKVIFGAAPDEDNPIVKEYADVTLNQWDISGPNNSGIYAALVAKKLGYKLIRLLGIPCDGNGHFYDIVPRKNTGFIPGVVDYLEHNKDRFRGVKSACGWSAVVLGQLKEGE